MFRYNMHFYSSERSIRKYRRLLPPWSQEGDLHFVTFRLYGSLPSIKLQALKDEIAIWRSGASGTALASGCQGLGYSLCLTP